MSPNAMLEHRLDFECYGANVSVLSDVPEPLIRLREKLPPHSVVTPSGGTSDQEIRRAYYTLRTNSNGTEPRYSIELGKRTWVSDATLEEALEIIEDGLHVTIAGFATGVIFVHAGAVAFDGKGILIPGRTHTGKSTFVRELIAAGATYYSDEYAVLDPDGFLHPYTRKLSLRDEAGNVTKCSPESLGASLGTDPVPVKLIVSAHYEPAGSWKPHRLSAGQAVLRLMNNTILARKEPERAIGTFARVMDRAICLEGTRGDAARTVRKILKTVASLDG